MSYGGELRGDGATAITGTLNDVYINNFRKSKHSEHVLKNQL